MRGYFGIGVYHPKTEHNIGTLWRSAFLYDAAYVFTIGQRYKKQSSDTPKSIRHIPLFHYETFEEFYKQLPYAAQLICIELDETSKPLSVVNHPPQAVYLLGAEDHGLPQDIIARGHQIVQIPAAKEQSMNVAVAGSIVMYDRHIKSLEKVQTLCS
jgi:tRNA(Leu) C34 or U34 (ribose-2'-O)-methylase TrmL